MGKLATLLFHPLAVRLYWLGWSLLVLACLALGARNGRYVPLGTKPGLCLDTRTGRVHLARFPPSLLDEAGTQDKEEIQLRQALTQ